MPEYTYEALAQTGIRNQGTLVATSEREALAMLDARGLFPIKISTKSIVAGQTGGKRIKKSLLCTFYAQLADLLHSGVPLLRSLDILERQTSNPSLGAVVREIRSGSPTARVSRKQWPSIRESLMNSSSAWFALGQKAAFSKMCSSASPISRNTKKI